MRSAGSHGIIDIFAFNSIEGLAIQVKRSKVNKILYPKEMAEMKILVFPPFILKQLWVWLDKQQCWKIYTVL
jgi:Holliday junction resolvase